MWSGEANGWALHLKLKSLPTGLVVCGLLGFAALVGREGYGQELARTEVDRLEEVAESSRLTSSSLPVTLLPDAPEAEGVRAGRERSRMRVENVSRIIPFSHIAFALNVGLSGLGFDAATALSQRWNLRAGASFLSGQYGFTASGASQLDAETGQLSPAPDGLLVNLKPSLRTVSTSLDWFPMYGNFHISPGVTLYSHNLVAALVTVKSGYVLDIGDGHYVSDAEDPLVVGVNMKFGRPVAPKLTVGWGNMLPRNGSRFSFPFELGVEYAGKPKVLLTLSGGECLPNGTDCGPVSDGGAETTANVLIEQQSLNKDLAPLRFYPILTTGVSYRF